MSELNTFLVSDSRYSDVSDKLSVIVKDGPASVIPQKYKHNSNSQSTTLYNVNVPSENTLIDRNFKIQGALSCYYETTVAAADAEFSFKVVPAAFPLNQALQSASLTINNSKVSVQSTDIVNILTKQFHQKFLSKHEQMTPNYVDKYYAKAEDAVSADATSSYMAGVEFAEKDSDTVGRADANFSVIVTLDDVVQTATDGLYTIATGNSGTLRVACTINLSESILGLPTLELKEEEAGYISINSLELVLQWNDMRNCFNISGSRVWKSYAGDTTNSLVLDDSSYLNLRYMSLHASQYAKLNSKNILPYDEYVAYKRNITGSDTGATEQTDVISMRQIPEKIIMVVRPQYKEMKPQFSNNLCYPISTLNITFNNVAGLLSSYDQRDLYVMSRRNGSQQTWNEFRGIVKNGDGTEIASLGSIVVIDPVRDLGLSDFLSSGSLGQFSFQATVSYSNILNHVHGSSSTNADGWESLEIATICNYAGILISDKGSSSTMSGLLTKQSVLEAKSSGKSVIDYEQVQQLTGGNAYKNGLTSFGSLYSRYNPKLMKGKVENISSQSIAFKIN